MLWHRTFLPKIPVWSYTRIRYMPTYKVRMHIFMCNFKQEFCTQTVPCFGERKKFLQQQLKELFNSSFWNLCCTPTEFKCTCFYRNWLLQEKNCLFPVCFGTLGTSWKHDLQRESSRVWLKTTFLISHHINQLPNTNADEVFATAKQTHCQTARGKTKSSYLKDVFKMQNPKYSPCCGSSSQKTHQSNQQLPIKKRWKCKYHNRNTVTLKNNSVIHIYIYWNFYSFQVFTKRNKLIFMLSSMLEILGKKKKKEKKSCHYTFALLENQPTVPAFITHQISVWVSKTATRIIYKEAAFQMWKSTSMKLSPCPVHVPQ